MNYLVKIKDLEIPFCIKNYKTSKSIKLYFKENILTVTKSPYISKKEVEKLIRKNEEKIYEEYKKILELKRLKEEQWQIGQTILYKGEKYIRCSDCGILVKKTSNRRKYCKDCGKIANVNLQKIRDSKKS